MKEMERAAFEKCYERRADMVYRLCYCYLKNPADAEDAVQETFLKLLRTHRTFSSPEHEKAWLIVVAKNICMDMLRRKSRQGESVDSRAPLPAREENTGLHDAIVALPERMKAAVYLYYFEGYSTPELAAMLKKPQATIRGWLWQARKLLKESLEGEKDV